MSSASPSAQRGIENFVAGTSPCPNEPARTTLANAPMHAPILYTFRRCPYAIRARMALLASNLECTVREVHLGQKPQALLDASPKATVPVLVLPDGRVIDQSLAIMLHALQANDPERWLDVDPQDSQALVDANDGGFKRELDGYKYPERKGGHRAQHHRAALTHLLMLETRLTQTVFLCGPRPSYADVALFPFVRQFAGVDANSFETQPLPRVRAWLSLWLASPLFQSAMITLNPWQPGDAEIRLGDPPTLRRPQL